MTTGIEVLQLHHQQISVYYSVNCMITSYEKCGQFYAEVKVSVVSKDENFTWIFKKPLNQP